MERSSSLVGVSTSTSLAMNPALKQLHLVEEVKTEAVQEEGRLCKRSEITTDRNVSVPGDENGPTSIASDQ